MNSLYYGAAFAHTITRGLVAAPLGQVTVRTDFEGCWQMIVSNGPRCLWRRVAGCIAAYALALHGILVAFAGLPMGARDISDANTTLRFELCIHDLTGDALFPETPGVPASNDTHCKFCIAVDYAMLVKLYGLSLPKTPPFDSPSQTNQNMMPA